MSDDFAQLLYHEAELLDAGRFDEWLLLLADNLRYWAPSSADLPRAAERASAADRLPLFDETRESLVMRVKRHHTGMAWSEVPATRTRRIVGNVVHEALEADQWTVWSNVLVFRSRSSNDDSLLACRRQDLWSHHGKWQLHARTITIDQRTIENLPLLL